MKKVLIWGGAIAVGGFLLLLAIGAMTPQETGEQIAARIKAACEQEYASQGQEEVNACMIRQELKAIEKGQAAREKAVERRVGG